MWVFFVYAILKTIVLKEVGGILATYLSVHRTENKYPISIIESASLKQKLSNIMYKDDYDEDGSGYTIRNLYFDSLDNDDYYEKLAGDKIRKKIRLRVYNPNDEKCKLEIKKKDGDYQHKISIWIKKEHAKKLINGDYSVLKNYFKYSSDALVIYKTMMLNCYRPRCLIEYQRCAFYYPYSNTRITIDTNIRASESFFDIFSEHPIYNEVLSNGAILEVKFDRKLIKVIKDILNPYCLTRISYSKYGMSRKLLNRIDL